MLVLEDSIPCTNVAELRTVVADLLLPRQKRIAHSASMNLTGGNVDPHPAVLLIPGIKGTHGREKALQRAQAFC